MFRGLCDNFILIGHTKDKLINKNGEEMAEMSLDLVGALANIICGEADAVGYVYRKRMRHISHLKAEIILLLKLEHLI